MQNEPGLYTATAFFPVSAEKNWTSIFPAEKGKETKNTFNSNITLIILRLILSNIQKLVQYY